MDESVLQKKISSAAALVKLLPSSHAILLANVLKLLSKASVRLPAIRQAPRGDNRHATRTLCRNWSLIPLLSDLLVSDLQNDSVRPISLPRPEFPRVARYEKGTNEPGKLSINVSFDGHYYGRAACKQRANEGTLRLIWPGVNKPRRDMIMG